MIRCKVGLISMVLLGSLIAPGAMTAQDAQYWTDQYGNRARLLGGAVIGSSNDLAAVYYNPGALALVANTQLLLAANVAQYTSYGVDIEGSESSVGSTGIGAAPSLFAGEINFKFLGDSRFAYSFLTRYDTDIRISEKALDTDPGASLPGLSAAGADLLFEESLTETWVGVTWSTPLGSHWGLGVSPYLTVRSQRFTERFNFQAVDTSDIATISITSREVDFLNWRLLAKIGLSARYDPWWFGATLTTPSLNIAGSGTAAVSDSRVSDDGTGELFTNLQEDVAVNYKSPVSIGAGLGYTWKETTTLHLAAEYFGAIAGNDVLDLEPLTDPETGDTITSGLTQEANAVLNWAVGLQHVFSGDFEAYAGFHSDYSARVETQQSSFPTARWNIWHFSTGAAANLGRAAFTLGTVVAWGSAPGEPIPATGDPEVDDGLGLPADTKISYFRLTFMLGFSILAP